MDVTTLDVGRTEFRLRRTPKSFFWLIPSAVVASLLLITVAGWFWGADVVRRQSDVVVFIVEGVPLLLFANALFPWLGLSIRDDALERKNSAATIALACALVSVTIAFAGGNLGNGPSFWENPFSGGLAVLGLIALWIGLESCGRVSVSIAEERDVASGLRFGGLLLSWGLILGRAAAGDWHSCLATVHDFFRDGWMAALILLVALVIELLVRPSRIRPFPSWFLCGTAPALFYLAAAIAWLWHLGRWEGMPT